MTETNENIPQFHPVLRRQTRATCDKCNEVREYYGKGYECWNCNHVQKTHGRVDQWIPQKEKRVICKLKITT